MSFTLNPMIAKKLTAEEKGIVLSIVSNSHPLLNCYRHPDFYRPTKADEIMGEQIPDISADWYARNMTARKTGYDKKKVLLTPEQEYKLFMRYNYARFKISTLRAKIKKQQKLNVVKLLEWYKEVAKIEDTLCRANLPLVLAVAGAFRTSIDWADRVEEGNNALLESVRKFDFTRKLKFSTLAFWSIKNALISFIEKQNKIFDNELQVADDSTSLEKFEAGNSSRPYSGKLTDLISAVVGLNMAELDEREIEVLRGRYPMDGSERTTLKVLAKRLGLSIPSIVRIEEISFAKLRSFLSENANKFGISEEIL